MLIGKFYHRLEEKGRLSLPKKFRQEATAWVVTRGLDGCLFLFKQENFESQLAVVTQRTFTKKANRDFVRLLTNEAHAVSTDKHGRVNLPDYLIKFAQLKQELVVVGSLERVEIWDRDRYHRYIDQLEDTAEQIAEQIDDKTTPASTPA